MDTNIFVYGIGAVMSLMVISLAGMAWRKRQLIATQVRIEPAAQMQTTRHP